MRAVLVKDRAANASATAELQQYIEVGGANGREGNQHHASGDVLTSDLRCGAGRGW